MGMGDLITKMRRLSTRTYSKEERSMPFSRHLEILLTVNEFFSTKLKKKENL